MKNKVFKGEFTKGIMYFNAENKALAMEHARHCAGHQTEFGNAIGVTFLGYEGNVSVPEMGVLIKPEGSR